MTSASFDRPLTGPVLAFDTSGPWLSAGVISGDETHFACELMARGQAERLLPFLEDLLTKSGLGWKDLVGLGVGVGPGNFTGIRIAISAARGLSLGLGLPLQGVSQFALARGLEPDAPADAPHLVALSAPQERIYLQLWQGGQAASAPQLWGIGETLNKGLEGAHSVLGHRAPEVAAALGLTAVGQATAPHVAPDSGAVLARLAAVALAEAPPGTAKPAPLYVRPADAAPPSDPPPVILDA